MITNSACTVQREREGGPNPFLSSPYNKFFLFRLPHFDIQYTIHPPTSSITVSLLPHLFPTAMPPYPPCTLFHIPPATLQPLQFYSPHLPVPTDPSQIHHVTNKCSTASPAPLSHITHLSLSFYISSYAPTTQLSQSSV